MIGSSDLGPLLTALPPSCRKRLLIMGWPDDRQIMRDPDRALRRAIGAPQPVSLVDLELDPERFHGAYISTSGTVGWSRETTALGRLWLDPSYCLAATSGAPQSYPAVFQARVTGIVLADAQIRADHRTRHHSPGGYGHFGLFIAELCAASIDVDPHSAATASSGSLPDPPGSATTLRR